MYSVCSDEDVTLLLVPTEMQICAMFSCAIFLTNILGIVHFSQKT